MCAIIGEVVGSGDCSGNALRVIAYALYMYLYFLQQEKVHHQIKRFDIPQLALFNTYSARYNSMLYVSRTFLFMFFANILVFSLS